MPPSEHEVAFTGYLRTLADDPGRQSAIKALRSGLHRRAWETPQMYPLVVPWMGSPARPRSAWSEECHFLIASLFASHPYSWPLADDDERVQPTNLGASLARIDASLAERLLTSCIAAQRGRQLRRCVTRIVDSLRRQHVPVDWPQLLHDLQWWNRNVQREWATAYYLSQRPETDEEDT
jgi:CRISPR system Cascade subunit CasB